MANNRIFIICDICNPEIGKWEYKDVVCIAKYYPSTGYYPNATTSEECVNFVKRLYDFFDKHRHEEVLDLMKKNGEPYLLSNEYNFRMEYESPK